MLDEINVSDDSENRTQTCFVLNLNLQMVSHFLFVYQLNVPITLNNRNCYRQRPLRRRFGYARKITADPIQAQFDDVSGILISCHVGFIRIKVKIGCYPTSNADDWFENGTNY